MFHSRWHSSFYLRDIICDLSETADIACLSNRGLWLLHVQATRRALIWVLRRCFVFIEARRRCDRGEIELSLWKFELGKLLLDGSIVDFSPQHHVSIFVEQGIRGLAQIKICFIHMGISMLLWCLIMWPVRRLMSFMILLWLQISWYQWWERRNVEIHVSRSLWPDHIRF